MATPLATLVRARTLGSVLPTVLAGLLLVGTGTATAAPPAPSPDAAAGSSAASSSAAGLVALNPSNRDSVAAAYRSVYLPSLSVKAPAVPADAARTCKASEAPAALSDAQRDLVNFFRQLSGVAPISFDKELSRKSHQAALISFANNSLSHQPDEDARCFTAEGAEAALNSTLGRNHTGADVVRSYMDDAGAANVDVPHRWWLQRPSVRTMGSGSVGSFNALWVNGATGAAPAKNYTSWPAAGYLPSTLEPRGRWSFTTWDANTSLQQAKVAVTRADGSAVKVTTRPVGGYDSLVFELGDLPKPTGSRTDTYKVTVSGIQQGGRAVDPYRYDVTLFDPNPVAQVASSLALTATATGPGAVRLGVTATAAGQATDGGTVDVLEGTKVLKRGVKLSEGRATVDLTGLAAGAHTFTARYAGTSRVAPSTGTVPAKVADRATAKLTTKATSPAVGKLTLSVKVTAPGETGIGGTVAVKEGKKTLKSGLGVRNGVVTWSAGGLKSGKHTYTVVYSGTARVKNANANVAAAVRAKVNPSLALKATSSAKGKVQVTATLKASGQRNLGGTVTIKEGSKTRKAKLKVSRGKATWTATKVKSAKHTYTVSYSGTSEVAGRSAKVTVRVR